MGHYPLFPLERPAAEVKFSYRPQSGHCIHAKAMSEIKELRPDVSCDNWVVGSDPFKS